MDFGFSSILKVKVKVKMKEAYLKGLAKVSTFVLLLHFVTLQSQSSVYVTRNRNIHYCLISFTNKNEAFI